MECDNIIDHFYVGQCVRTCKDVEALRKIGITAVVNLQTSEDETYTKIDWPSLEVCYRSRGIEVVRVPVRDFDEKDLADKLPECLRAVERLIGAGHTVYVHCTAGTGRSPSVAIAYLHWKCGMRLEKAYEYARSRRSCSPTLQLGAMRRLMRDPVLYKVGEGPGQQ